MFITERYKLAENLYFVAYVLVFCTTKSCLTITNYKFIKLQPFIRFVDVSATTAAFIRMSYNSFSLFFNEVFCMHVARALKWSRRKSDE